jgi:N-acetylmuramoyl-L-alanine amidase
MKIAVDPGHGMSNATPGVFDPGAVAREGGVTLQEADIALRYGLALRDVLRARSIDVFMTRDHNNDPGWRTRRQCGAGWLRGLSLLAHELLRGTVGQRDRGAIS